MPSMRRGRERYKIAMIGIGSMESIPVYHYNPGGTVVRVAFSSIETPAYKCDVFPICVFGEGSRVLSFQEVDESFILGRLRAWSATSIFIDGLEPLNSLSREALNALRLKAKSYHYTLGARTLGLADIEKIKLLDYVVIDYMRDYSLEPALPGNAIKLLYDVLDLDAWVEVSAYLKEPDIKKLHPLIVALEGTRVPLHVFIEDHKGGGPVRDLYSTLSDKLYYVYIHNDMYPRLDTLCPNCKAPIASRDEGVLRSLELRESKCWKCGYTIPFQGSIRKKTPSQLLLTVDEGGVKWYHPSQLIGGFGFWASPT
ncbi:MAG: hypothetical protein F7C82_02225 [Desulfurococcales archaeon]|nr:hypothetical protein [Desulfurococcales archaeon]MCE4622264.1 hypothetical protein [Desulfurococcales archaeon]MCE4626564.1 hypothetical protein [Desulfurococcales archaeon]MCE4629076.1 hypothetical protein [Desulfurococcales archaeon]